MSTTRDAFDEYWPTEPWLETYRAAMEASERLTDAGSGWGVGWEGAMIFDIADVPAAEQTVADFPDEVVSALTDRFHAMDDDRAAEVLAAAPEDRREAVAARAESPSEALLAALLDTPVAAVASSTWDELDAELPPLFDALVTEIEANVVEDDTVYAYLDLYDGGCREVATLSPPEERDHGFVISGTYPVWKDLVSADADVISLIISGDMTVDGDMQKILQYSDAAVVLTEIAGELDSRFLF
ncbi:MAG: SCP2 sterol-binding domain-containing protein [Haloarculaceae archaeon]